MSYEFESTETVRVIPILKEPPRIFNFVMETGDGDAKLGFTFNVKRTFYNRLRYWLFCKFFPFRITRWDKV